MKALSCWGRAQVRVRRAERVALIAIAVSASPARNCAA